MKQQTFSDIEYSGRKRKTKREEFLDSMDQIIPWDSWVDMIRPYYYKNRRGRRPRNIETMLRMYLMQNWFNILFACANLVMCIRAGRARDFCMG